MLSANIGSQPQAGKGSGAVGKLLPLQLRTSALVELTPACAGAYRFPRKLVGIRSGRRRPDRRRQGIPPDNGRRRRKASGVRATTSVPATRCRSYLADPPIDVVKLDRSFVTGIAGDVDRYLFTCTIVDIARSLKLHVVGCRGCRDNGAVASSGHD